MAMLNTYYTINDCPLSFAFLADLHDQPFDKIISSLRKHRPPLILIAGDLIKHVHPSQLLPEETFVIPFLRSCLKIAPVYLSFGNHEMFISDEDIQEIQELGVHVLDNASAQVGNALIGGLTSGYLMANRALHVQYFDHQARSLLHENEKSSLDLAWLHRYACRPGYHILLCHHPEYYDLIPSPVELILAGHAHGGQWDYYSFKDHRPKGIYAPGQGFFPAYTSGLYHDRLLVSRGLSNPVRLPRLFNPPEIIYVNMPAFT